MAVEQPTASDALNSPDHSLAHRIIAADHSASAESLTVQADDSTRVKALWVSETNAVSSADYTILDADGYSDIDFTTAAVDRTCTLPTLADNLGRIIFISKVDSGAGKVTVSREGSDTFLDGSTSIDLPNQGDTLAIKGSSSGWKIF